MSLWAYIAIGLCITAVVAVGLGFFGRRVDQARKEGYEDAHEQFDLFKKSLDANREADSQLNDPAYRQRLFDEDNRG